MLIFITSQQMSCQADLFWALHQAQAIYHPHDAHINNAFVTDICWSDASLPLHLDIHAWNMAMHLSMPGEHACICCCQFVVVSYSSAQFLSCSCITAQTRASVNSSFVLKQGCNKAYA